MEFHFKYKKVNENSFEELNISIDDYFSELESWEKENTIDSLPKHNNPLLYINEPPEKINFICLIFKNHFKERVENYSYWNNGKNYVLELQEKLISEKIYYESMTIYTKSEDDNNLEIITIISFKRGNNNIWIPVQHSITIDKIGEGTINEIVFDKNGYNTGNISGWSDGEWR